MNKSLLTSILSLFTSLSTLLCCALPALLVTIGAGATLAGLTANIPQLIWLSERKAAVFLFAGAMLIIAGILKWQARFAARPIDPVKANACMKARQYSHWLYRFSVLIYLVGAFFAFLADDLLI